MQIIKRSTFLALVFVLVFSGGCAQQPSTATVKIIVDIEKTEDHAEYPGEFWPEYIVVKRGTVVTWTNSDDKEHKLISSGLFNHFLSPGASFSHTFKEAGQFKYSCELFHEMMGEVVVE